MSENPLPSVEKDALAHAWDVGFDAAAERARSAVLLAVTVGIKEALRQIEAERPVANPYRVTSPGGLTEDSFCGACGRLLSEPPIPECIKPEWHDTSPASTAERDA